MSEIYQDDSQRYHGDISDATATSFGYLSDVGWSKNYSFAVNKYQMNANWIKSQTHRLCDGGDWMQNPELERKHPSIRLPDDVLLKAPDVLGLSFDIGRSTSLTSIAAATTLDKSDIASAVALDEAAAVSRSHAASQWVAVRPQPPYSSLDFSFDGAAQRNSNDRSAGGELGDDSSSVVTGDDLNYGFGYDSRIYEDCPELCGESVDYRQNFLDVNFVGQTAADLVGLQRYDGDTYQRNRLGAVPSFCTASRRTAVVAPNTAAGNHQSAGKRHSGPAVPAGDSGSQPIRGFHLSNADKVDSSSRCYAADQIIPSAYRCIPSVGMLQSGGRVLVPAGRTLEVQTVRNDSVKNEAFGRDN